MKSSTNFLKIKIMEIEKIPALLEEHNKRIKKLEEEVYPFTKITLVPASGPHAEKDETPGLAELVEPRIVNGNIFIPLLGRTIAVDFIENEEKYNWKQAMDYCKEHGLELPSKDEALILLWQFDKINALLRSMGKPEISKESWFWTKTECSATHAWYWFSGSWYYGSLGKDGSLADVPFFAID